MIQNNNNNSNIYDNVIIGGGIAGLYASIKIK